MNLQCIDWLIIIAYLLVSLIIGLIFQKRASKSITDFFLGGRAMPWYLAGVSMVATTFAADTPLAVTELVAKHGIAGNWLWWNMLLGGMLTVFFFSHLWRRAGILTEVEFIELRYGGKPAALLRGFKAVYLGLIMNCLIIAWVNLAMVSIIQIFFDVSFKDALFFTGLIMLLTAVYSAISGLWGVAVTDAIQFFIAMAGCIVLAIIVVNSDAVGGIEGLKSKLPAEMFSFFPSFSEAAESGNVTGILTLSVGSFLAYLCIWWTSWYPGAEPGGGGYIAQRMMSAKNEKHSIYATLFFQIAHYCIRPWPWIIVGLCTLVIYPDLSPENKRLGYVMAMKDFLPTGLRGLLIVAFLAAYMSTISTQLNWGASYLVNDLYKRFIKPESPEAPAQKHYVKVSRWITFMTMVISLLVTSVITTISGVWSFIIECGAGLGLVLILRWYWWRINAWSEITATAAPFIFYSIATFFLKIPFPQSFFFTVGFTTISWVVVTFFTNPENIETLKIFFQRVQPGGFWRPVTKTLSGFQYSRLLSWLSAAALTYSILFLTGAIIFRIWDNLLTLALTCLISFFLLVYSLLQKKS